MSMEAEIVAAVQLLPFGEGGAELGMTRAEMLDQLHQIENSIMSTLEFQTQIIFGWLVAMFFVDKGDCDRFLRSVGVRL